jgi:mannitol-1-/sugar-/sorbitol-6-phosphatase
MIFDCDAVLFDMDGTLVDSTVCVEAMWRKWAARHHLDADGILAVCHGRRTVDTIAEVVPHLDVTVEAQRFEAEELEAEEGVVGVAGAAGLLAAISALEWAVVTSASRELAARRLRLGGLPVPMVLVGADDVRRGKPDPEGYLTAAQRLGFAPENCLVVEDTPAGIESGRAGGMQVIGITTTYPPRMLRGVPCIENFTGIRVSRSVVEGGRRLRMLID